MTDHTSDQDRELKLQHQADIVATMNNPICHHEFPKINISLHQLTHNIIDKCTAECYLKYKTTDEGKIRSSVDINPKAWVNIFVFSIIKANETSGNLQVPNGCDNADRCRIQKFYEIIYAFFSEVVMYA